MLVTEEEAKERWCPLFQARFYAGVGKGLDEKSCCIASQCMAWRWEQIRQPVPSTDPMAETAVKLVQGERGLCGLAERGRGPFG